MRNLARLAAALSVCAACTTTGRYDPKFFAPLPIAPDKRLDGRALVLMTPEDDTYVFSGRPTSVVGSAGTLVVPLGQITREAALNVFGALFRGGAEAATTRPDPGTYRVIVSPHVERFSYSYGFTEFRPVAAVSVSVLDPDGRRLDRRTYESAHARVSVPSPLKDPGGFVGQATQAVVQSLMIQAAADVRRTLLAEPEVRPVAPPAP